MGNAINTQVEKFLKAHNFFVEVEGLEKLDQLEILKSGSANLGQVSEGKKIIVIDAGGTNFRSCLVEKKAGGELEISDFQKTSMPAIDRELSKREFYFQIARNIERLKNKSDTISFCFSYAMQIVGDDARILRFSKEVKAPEAVGTYVCHELKKALIVQGWSPSVKIHILNDTAALLLSGCALDSKKWGGHVAFILGTGMNSAYVANSEIVVTECGMLNDVVQSDFDKAVDENSTNPGKSLLEKMCSGAYIGQIAYKMLLTACEEGLLSKQIFRCHPICAGMTAADFDGFFADDNASTSSLQEVAAYGSINDRQVIEELLQKLIERAAYICSNAILSAVKHSDTTSDLAPLCISCNGSTFWKTPHLTQLVETCLKKKLDRRFELVQTENDITAGSFVAAFIQSASNA